MVRRHRHIPMPEMPPADGGAAPAGPLYPVASDRLPSRTLDDGPYAVRFARSAKDLDAVLRLRYEVFNLELGEGFASAHQTGRDEDEFDPVCHHLMVVERHNGRLVGSYRLQTSGMAARHRGFYSATLFDLEGLPGEVLAGALEIGRACVARHHRSTQVLFLLWKGLALYVAANRKRYLFGCSSLTSQDPGEGKRLMEMLEARGHLHPQLHVEPRPERRCYEAGFAADPKTEVKMPTLFKTYLRHGAKVCGPPAIDRQFKTIDFLMLFDVAAMDRRMFRLFFDS